MKKFMVLLLLASVSGGIAIANPQNCADRAQKATISEALKMQEDSYVTIQGNIIKKISKDKYQFKDSTGTMTVEIDYDKWAGIPENTKDRLELTGEIEKEMNSTELDVDFVKKVNK